MTTPEAARLFAAAEATWPAASHHEVGPWTIREGQGGGSRVSAATAGAAVTSADLRVAEAEMRKLGQTPLVMVRGGEDALDDMLEAEGYRIKDPVTIYAAPVAELARQRPPPVTTFEVWPPLAAQTEIWAAGGIGPARLAIMERAPGPKTTILGRAGDTPAGTLIVAINDRIAMAHAIETVAGLRRQGVGRNLMAAAAFWARDHGAETLALLVTRANAGANALYASLGMTAVGQYHYRIKDQ